MGYGGGEVEGSLTGVRNPPPQAALARSMEENVCIVPIQCLLFATLQKGYDVLAINLSR